MYGLPIILKRQAWAHYLFIPHAQRRVEEAALWVLTVLLAEIRLHGLLDQLLQANYVRMSRCCR